MPRISEFYGIAIYLYYRDHAPPHFHALYGAFDAEFSIETGDLLRGKFPRRAAGLVKEWATRYKVDLTKDWDLAREQKPLKDIPPLD